MRVDDPSGSCSPSVYGPQSDFEAVPHRQLLKMLDGASNNSVHDVAKKLSDASSSLNDIAGRIRSHMSNLEWESSAGDSFRDWGGKVASATFTLADYAGNAGAQMSAAADTLSTVQGNIPKVPEGAATTVATYRAHKGIAGPYADAAVGAPVRTGTPPPTDAEYHSALDAMTTAHTEAADKMTTLGSSYSSAGYLMAQHDEPVFPPMSKTFMPPEPSSEDSSKSLNFGGSSSGTSGAVGSGMRSPSSTPAQSGQTTTHTTGSTLQLDGMSTGHHTGGTVTVDPPTTPLPPGGPGRPPTTVLPPPTSGYPEPGGDPLYPGMPGGQGSGRTPGRLLPGEEPPGALGMPKGQSAYRTYTSEGIAGGRLAEPEAGGFGSPRLKFSAGTVVGEGPGGVPGEGMAPGSSMGRSLAGGAPYGRSGAGAIGEEPGAGMTGGRPMAGGMGGLGGGGRQQQRGRRAGNRPDWLVEEEDTWMSGGQDVVPSVLD